MRLLRAYGIIALLCCAEQNPSGEAIFGHAVLAGISDHSGTDISINKLKRTTVTDKYGYFALPDIPQGNFIVSANRRGTLERSVSKAINHDGRTPSQTYLVLTPIGRLVGSVQDENQQPIIGASVTILGTEARTTTIEGGQFTIDPAPAGQNSVMVTATTFVSNITPVEIPVGGNEELLVELARSVEIDPYAQNTAPVITEIAITAYPEDAFPRPIPLVSTTGGKVRRRGLYSLSVTTSDEQEDEVMVFWRADRGTLMATEGYEVLWRAGVGTSTLVATAVDEKGATATTRAVFEASGDNIRSAGIYDTTVYYAERRDQSFDIYSYDLVSGEEYLFEGVEDPTLEQHAVKVVDDWLLWADMEFLFIGPLVYRMSGYNLASDMYIHFGQSFGHDDSFVMRIDLYSPLDQLFIPYQSSDPTLAPLGYGYFDVQQGLVLDPSPYTDVPSGPINLQAFTRTTDRDLWLDGDGWLWSKQLSGSAEQLVDTGFAPLWPVDFQTDGIYVAWLPNANGSLYWATAQPDAIPSSVGFAVTSYALSNGKIVWVEQGPSSASIEVLDLNTMQTWTLTTEPHFSRRIWHVDNEWVIWGDQGTEGQSFIALNSELLWIARIDQQ